MAAAFVKVPERTIGKGLTTFFFESTGQIESNYDEITDSFDSMDLKAELLRGMCYLKIAP